MGIKKHKQTNKNIVKKIEMKYYFWSSSFSQDPVKILFFNLILLKQHAFNKTMLSYFRAAERKFTVNSTCHLLAQVLCKDHEYSISLSSWFNPMNLYSHVLKQICEARRRGSKYSWKKWMWSFYLKELFLLHPTLKITLILWIQCIQVFFMALIYLIWRKQVKCEVCNFTEQNNDCFQTCFKTLLYLPLVNQTDNPAPKLILLVELLLRESQREMLKAPPKLNVYFFFFFYWEPTFKLLFSCKLGWD